MVKKRPLGVLGLIVVVWIAAGACGGASPSGATCPPTSTLTYDNFGKDFFEANCLRCHSSNTKGKSPLYDDVTQIRSNISKIDEQAASGPKSTNTEMPNDAEIAESERKKLGEWLACGAK